MKESLLVTASAGVSRHRTHVQMLYLRFGRGRVKVRGRRRERQRRIGSEREKGTEKKKETEEI